MSTFIVFFRLASQHHLFRFVFVVIFFVLSDSHFVRVWGLGFGACCLFHALQEEQQQETAEINHQAWTLLSCLRECVSIGSASPLMSIALRYSSHDTFKLTSARLQGFVRFTRLSSSSSSSSSQ
jgi:hypothetical protein